MTITNPADITSGDDGKNTQAGAGAATQAATPVVEVKFTQEDVDRIIRERLAEEKRRNETQAEKIKRQAEDEAKAKQGEYQALAEQRAARIAELEPVAEQNTRLQELMERQIKDRLKNLPEEIRAMQPDGDVLARFDWLSKAEAAAAKLQAARSPGTPPGPKGNGAAPSGAIVATTSTIRDNGF